MKSLILAGGFGTRLYPLTLNKPKALLQYRGKPIINYIVDKIPEDIEILVNTNKKFEPNFRKWQETLSRKITLCVEPVSSEKESLGAIGSLARWVLAYGKDDLLVIASDNYFEFDLSGFISAYSGKNTLVAVYDIGDRSKARHFGVVQLEGDKITTLDEKPARPKSSYIATACYLFPPRIYSFITEFASENSADNLGSLIAYLMIKDEVHAYVFNELWLDIGSPDDLS